MSNYSTRHMTDYASIDQNSNPLWDTLPKLAALTRQGIRVVHCVEDIDVAFTRQGATADDTRLELAPECYYRSGNSDWGATLFYTDFLGRSPINIRTLEPYTGQTMAALSRRLNLSIDELYGRYAGSDNWQLIGASYAGHPHAHRTSGDLAVAETAPHLRALLEHARHDLENCFPETAARERIDAWFSAESALLEELLTGMAEAPLVRLYQAWLRRHLPENCELRLTSEHFPLAPASAGVQLLTLFLRHYPECTALYNQAVTETESGQKPLDTGKGELPFFAVFRREGRCFRVPLVLQDQELRVEYPVSSWPLMSDGSLPLTAMHADGVVCIVGKALLLVLQARLQPAGAPLALPYNGSLYMPAAYALERKMAAAGLLPAPVHPVIRVKFDFIEAWRDCATIIRLPAYLRELFPTPEMTAAELSGAIPAVMDQAQEELAEMKTREGRNALLARLYPADTAILAELDHRRRELAASPEGRLEAGRLWDGNRELETRQFQRLFERALLNRHVLNLDYWNSRGALLPWAIALGGDEFYERLLADTQVYEESAY